MHVDFLEVTTWNGPVEYPLREHEFLSMAPFVLTTEFCEAWGPKVAKSFCIERGSRPCIEFYTYADLIAVLVKISLTPDVLSGSISRIEVEEFIDEVFDELEGFQVSQSFAAKPLPLSKYLASSLGSDLSLQISLSKNRRAIFRRKTRQSFHVFSTPRPVWQGL